MGISFELPTNPEKSDENRGCRYQIRFNRSELISMSALAIIATILNFWFGV